MWFMNEPATLAANLRMPLLFKKRRPAICYIVVLQLGICPLKAITICPSNSYVISPLPRVHPVATVLGLCHNSPHITIQSQQLFSQRSHFACSDVLQPERGPTCCIATSPKTQKRPCEGCGVLSFFSTGCCSETPQCLKFSHS